MKELELKYGCNPNQKPAKIYMKDGSDLPYTVLNGKPGYINYLDALNSWQLVKELAEATGKIAAASFKHVSPAGAAVEKELSDIEKAIYFVKKDIAISPVASAYIRARGTDRVSSYGDFVAVSSECDESLALYLKSEVSDGIIAPSYSPEALEILKNKKKGNFVIIQMDKDYIPKEEETKDVFGITLSQGHNFSKINEDLLNNIVTINTDLTKEAKIDMLVSLITLKYTQSNSVCYVKDGQAIGVGAGQQSRILCTRLAGQKADNWWLRQHPKVLSLDFLDTVKRPDKDNAIDVYISDDYEDILDNWQLTFKTKPEVLSKEEKKEWIKNNSNITIGSDAFFPFGDNILRAYRSGCKYVVEPGGSIRDDNVIETCDKHDIVMCFTGLRLFHH